MTSRSQRKQEARFPPHEERDALAEACRELADRVCSPALRARLVTALSDAGVAPRGIDELEHGERSPLTAKARTDVLAGACIELADLADDPEIVARARAALAAAGFEALDPEGEVFDPHVHAAVQRVQTRDRALQNRVAATERVGYSYDGRLVRPAEVAVYRIGTEGA